MANVVLIDAGGTNIGSVRYALQRLGVDAPLSSNADEIRAATHVILPGVGAAAPGMQRLRETGLVDVVRGLTQPVLGVCLGMQLLFEHSEESVVGEQVADHPRRKDERKLPRAECEQGREHNDCHEERAVLAGHDAAFRSVRRCSLC